MRAARWFGIRVGCRVRFKFSRRFGLWLNFARWLWFQLARRHWIWLKLPGRRGIRGIGFATGIGFGKFKRRQFAAERQPGVVNANQHE